MGRNLIIAALTGAGLLAVAAPAASAEYWFVGKTDQAVMLLDRPTVTTDGRFRSAEAILFNRNQRFDPNEAYTILSYQFDCEGLASKIARIVVFNEADAVLSDEPTSASPLAPEKPGTLGREALSLVCETKAYPIPQGMALPQAKQVAAVFLKPAAQ